MIGQRRFWRSATVALLVAAPVMVAAGCRTATDVTVTIVTDVPCATGFGGATITVGSLGAIESQPPTSTKATCTADGKVGSIVVVPSGANDALVAMKIVMGVGHSPDTCTVDNGYTGGCIVARRALRYVPHEELHVVVSLAAACTDVPCASTETCVDRICRPATIDDPTKCEDPAGCGDNVLGDGGAGDATMGGDGSVSDASTNDSSVDGGPPVTSAIMVGDTHSCAMTPSGGVKCWGQDSVDQLGHNGGGDSVMPVDVVTTQSAPLTGVAALFGARDTTCAVLTTGNPKCWGIALDTPDPDGGAPNTYSAATDWLTLAGATDISVGYHFLCWRIGTSSVKCMGRNDDGELENGGTTYGLPPVTSLVASPIIGVATGEYFSCALRGNGEVACAGDNGLKNVDPFSASNSVPAPHVITPLPAMAEVRAGTFFACGRVASDSSVQCWGDDTAGQAGYPSDAGRIDAPHTIQLAGGGALVGVKAISLGDQFACAITSTNDVVCWGANESAQLGRGDPMTVGTQASTASPVVGASNIVALAVTADHACAMNAQHQVVCWGKNGHGECGVPVSTPMVMTATQVAGF